jgi:hypothetical protein
MEYTNIEEFKAAMLTQPHNFGYHGELDLSVWGFTPFTMNRDSDILAQSNFKTALAIIKKVAPKYVEVMHTRHWAVGWLDHIMVKTTSKKAMTACFDLYTRLQNYPILDEEDLSRREVEQANSAYDSWARFDVRKMVEEAHIVCLLDEDGDYDPKPEDEDKVKGLVAGAILDHDPIEGTYKDSDLVRMIAEAFPNFEKDTLTLPLPF